MEDYYYYNNIKRDVQDIWIAIVAIFLILCLSLGYLTYRVDGLQKHRECVVENKECEHCLTSILCDLDSLAKLDVSDSLALSLMKDLDMQHPHIVLAQMKLESGHYQSKLAKENNNYFGMRHPAQRLTVSVKSKNGYAHYRNWCYSVLDYALWQRRYAYNLSEDDYLTKLSNVYAEDEKYIDKVSKIAKNIWEN
jgi:hypothetical protein